MLEERADEELDGVLDAEQVEEVEQVEVEERQFGGRLGQRDGAGVAQTPEPDAAPGGGARHVVQQGVDRALQDLGRLLSVNHKIQLT